MASSLNEKQELRLIAMKNLDNITKERSRLETELGETNLRLDAYKKGMENKKKEIAGLQVYKAMYEKKVPPKGTQKRKATRKQRAEKKGRKDAAEEEEQKENEAEQVATEEPNEETKEEIADNNAAAEKKSAGTRARLRSACMQTEAAAAATNTVGVQSEAAGQNRNVMIAVRLRKRRDDE